MEKTLSMGDRIKDLERQHNKEAHKLEQRLMKEMGICFAELQSLVNICVQRAEGQDPNISVLLGVKGKSLVQLYIPNEGQDPNISVLLGVKGKSLVQLYIPHEGRTPISLYS